jgi:hypothetical protein
MVVCCVMTMAFSAMTLAVTPRTSAPPVRG